MNNKIVGGRLTWALVGAFVASILLSGFARFEQITTSPDSAAYPWYAALAYLGWFAIVCTGVLLFLRLIKARTH